ncbi:putative nuclease HARBI1 [Diprion similis]|uniref:putative nuclease HARBI1 n=1 Tax=Diprion similis TaxID=362088 RepID=UPI001EF8A48D|nr:putative nuclease HARBI1 [Diprion similis]
MVRLEQLIQLVGPKIAKKDTPMRQAIPVKERMVVILRFLASGDSYSSLQFLFRIPVCTISRIVTETTRAIYDVLKREYLRFPNTAEDWLRISETFNERWNFPHYLGALDGKHFVIQAPNNSGSTYYNYKGTHSIILMATVDANYKFTYIDVGYNGRASDGGVFENSSLKKGLEENTVRLPPPEPLPGREIPVPYVFVADDAFVMRSYILKRYPFRNQPAPNLLFNYRLSRAHRIVENAFGIIANTFRVLRRPIDPLTATVANLLRSL